jgi:putative aldouronate transport system substrate-binding protein
MKKGYTSEDFLTNSTQALADWYAGQCLQVYGTPGALVDTALSEVAPEAEMELVNIGNIPRIKSINYDWGLAISASDQDKVDAWLRFYNWMYASQENYDFCIYGVEGKDYERDANGNITKLVTDTFFAEWFMGCSKYRQFSPLLSEEAVERYKHLDDNAQISKKMGFVFDSSSVSVEVAALSAVYTEYIKPIADGFKDYDQNIDEAIAKLKDAGLDKYVAEVQRQFSEFYAENH